MKRILFLVVSLVSIFAQADIVYRQALESDADIGTVVQGVLDMLKDASSDSDKILILPEACRKAFVEGMIKHSYLFVAMDGNKVIATKKLFIAKGEDKKDILENLIRAEGSKVGQGEPSFRGKINNDGRLTSYANATAVPAMGIAIYDGFEYTRDAYRGKGINKKLTEFAYSTIAKSVSDELNKSPIKRLTLLYALMYPNAGQRPDMKPDRTPGLATTFRAFIQKHIAGQTGPIVLELSRYKSYLPTYKPDSKDCNSEDLRPDVESAPIYGYIMTYELK